MNALITEPKGAKQMSEHKHTPGPWKYVKSIGVYAGDKWEIVSFGSCSTEEGHANAQLIAAAPDMLEACEMALQDMIRLGIFGPGRNAVESAIKKARGG